MPFDANFLHQSFCKYFHQLLSFSVNINAYHCCLNSKEQMKNCDVLKRVPACREYLAKIFKDLTLHKRPIVRERKPNTTRMIFVAGGYFQHSLDILEGYNVDDRTWTTLPKLTVPRSGLGAAFLKGTFYAVGGRNNAPGASYDSDWVDR